MTEHHVPWCASISSADKSRINSRWIRPPSSTVTIFQARAYKFLRSNGISSRRYDDLLRPRLNGRNWTARGGRRQKLARPNKWSHSTGPEFIIARGEIVVVPRLWPWNFSDDSDTRDMVNLSSKVKFLATRKSVDSDLFHGNENINNMIFLEDKERDVKKIFFSLLWRFYWNYSASSYHYVYPLVFLMHFTKYCTDKIFRENFFLWRNIGGNKFE